MEKINFILSKVTTFCLSSSMALLIFIAYAELTNSSAIANTGTVIEERKIVKQSPVVEKSAAPATAKAPAKEGGFSVKVEVTEAIRENFENNINSVGTLLSAESVEVKSEISGKVLSAPFVNGSFVKAGTILFVIENSVQQAELAKASAKQILWQNNVNRYTKLVKNGAVSKFQLDDATANLGIAKAESDYAKAILEKTLIKAPFDAVVGIRRVSVGDYVNPQQTLVNIDQNKLLKLQFIIPEKFAGRLELGSEVLFETAKYPNLKLKASVTSIDSRVDQKTRGILVEALYNNNEGQLSSGQFANVFVSLSKTSSSISLPSQAIIPLGNKNFVYKVIDGKVEQYEVKTGNRNLAKVEILEGVTDGEIIVTAGQQKLKDGTPVRISEPSIVELTYMEEEKPMDKN